MSNLWSERDRQQVELKCKVLRAIADAMERDLVDQRNVSLTLRPDIERSTSYGMGLIVPRGTYRETTFHGYRVEISAKCDLHGSLGLPGETSQVTYTKW